jgi:hypothetical protein
MGCWPSASKAEPIRDSAPVSPLNQAEEKIMAVKKSATKVPATLLSGEQVGEVARMLKDVDTVELKLIVPMDVHRATIQKLGLDPVEAEARQVFFFDTPSFALDKAGLVVRARRIQGGAGDTVVKRRPMDPATIDAELRRSASFKTEIDGVPGGFVCSGSLKGKCKGREVLDAVGRTMPLDRLFSKEQRAFFRKHAPKGTALGSLTAYGPIFVLKATLWPKKLDRRLVVEMWLFPDGSRNLEISAKCEPSQVFNVNRELKEFLTDLGIEITGNQQTKTRAAMAFFGAELKKAARKGKS